MLSRYSEAMGVAYQIRDDLEDFDSPAPGSDLARGRPSVLLALACRWARGADLAVLNAAWGDDARGAAGQVRRIMERLDVAGGAGRLLDAYKDQAIQSLCGLEHMELKRLLRRLITKVFGDTEVMGCCNDYRPRNA